ncbi:MAG: nitroimidazol reductase NimA-like FMN-containing flavoprotein [Haloarculaceae archaeon]|jgi:nitroimidazol reductase NimA-like FMN-containing flavoprotein (pyridoxamine 5'-phosphate oxidase superfamily)
MTDSTARIGKDMTPGEIASVLTSKNIGVLSLGSENRGYGFPMSYTYEEANDRIILGFVSSPESQKEAFVEQTDEATLTIYDWTDVDSWTSVIAEGPIGPLEGDEKDFNVPDMFFSADDDHHAGEDELVNIDSFERTWYELDIRNLSGRHSGD